MPCFFSKSHLFSPQLFADLIAGSDFQFYKPLYYRSDSCIIELGYHKNFTEIQSFPVPFSLTKNRTKYCIALFWP